MWLPGDVVMLIVSFNTEPQLRLVSREWDRLACELVVSMAKDRLERLHGHFCVPIQMSTTTRAFVKRCWRMHLEPCYLRPPYYCSVCLQRAASEVGVACHRCRTSVCLECERPRLPRTLCCEFHTGPRCLSTTQRGHPCRKPQVAAGVCEHHMSQAGKLGPFRAGCRPLPHVRQLPPLQWRELRLFQLRSVL